MIVVGRYYRCFGRILERCSQGWQDTWNGSARVRDSLRLEALPAQNRSALRRLKRHGRLDAAGGTLGSRLGSRDAGCGWSCTWTKTHASSPGLAGLAPFWVVLKLFIEEEQLFPSGEDEFTATVDTRQQTISKFHAASPVSRGKDYRARCDALSHEKHTGTAHIAAAGCQETRGGSSLAEMRFDGRLKNQCLRRPALSETERD